MKVTLIYQALYQGTTKFRGGYWIFFAGGHIFPTSQKLLKKFQGGGGVSNAFFSFFFLQLTLWGRGHSYFKCIKNNTCTWWIPICLGACPFAPAPWSANERNIMGWDQQNYLFIRRFCYIRPPYNKVLLYFEPCPLLLNYAKVPTKWTCKFSPVGIHGQNFNISKCCNIHGTLPWTTYVE